MANDGAPNVANNEAVKVGYQVAVNLMTAEGSLIWGRFQAMLVANSIILGAIVLLLTKGRWLFSLFPLGLSFAGLVLCAMWLLMTARGFDNYNYWIDWAKKLEKDINNSSVKTLTDYPERHRTCNVKVECLSHVVIVVFMLIYLVLFAAPFWAHLCRW